MLRKASVSEEDHRVAVLKAPQWSGTLGFVHKCRSSTKTLEVNLQRQVQTQKTLYLLAPGLMLAYHCTQSKTVNVRDRMLVGVDILPTLPSDAFRKGLT